MLIHEQLGIYQVRLPLPFHMNHVNCFAVKGSTGWCLIDTGLKIEENKESWRRFFAEQSIKPSDISSIYVTHFHADHYGCAGWLQNYTGGAPVYMGEIEAARVACFWENRSGASELLHALFSSNGMPESVWVEVLAAFVKVVVGTAPPHPKLTIIEPGQNVLLGDYEYQVILIPGHSDGHICFYNETHDVFLAGDNLLPEVNISLWPQPFAAANPLHDFFNSLNWMRSLDCQFVISGHGRPFHNIEDRISRIETHHRNHSALLKSYVENGTTAYQVCRQVYPQDIGFFELRFAMAETLAHLAYLTFSDDLETSVRDDGIIIYNWKP